MSTHTDGPWHIEHSKSVIRSADGALIADVWSGFKRIAKNTDIEALAAREANAKLIAAAPAMFAALQTITLHASSLDAQGIQQLCDEALQGIVDDVDPSPYCQYCGAKRATDCHCGPIAENN